MIIKTLVYYILNIKVVELSIQRTLYIGQGRSLVSYEVTSHRLKALPDYINMLSICKCHSKRRSKLYLPDIIMYTGSILKLGLGEIVPAYLAQAGKIVLV